MRTSSQAEHAGAIAGTIAVRMLPVAITAALVPILMVPGWFLYFDSAPKACALLAGVAALLIFGGERLDADVGVLRASRAGRLYLVLVVGETIWVVLCSVWSSDPGLSLLGSGWRRMGAIEEVAMLALAVCAAARVAAVPGRLPVLLRAIAGSGALIGAYAVAQYFGFDPLIDPEAYRVLHGPFATVRPPGTLGHADHLGNYMIFVLLAAAGLWRAEAGRSGKWFAAGCGAVAAAALVVSGTRSALAGAAVGALTLAASVRPALTRVRVATMLLAFAALGGFYASDAGAPLRDRVAEWIRLDRAGGARLPLWQDTLRMAGARVWRGFGPETFSGDFPRFQSAALARDFPNAYFESPHNVVLEWVVAEGIPGLALRLAMLGLALSVFFRSRRAHAEAAAVAAGLAGLFVGQQFIGFVLPTALAFHLAIGVLIAGAKPDLAPASKKRAFSAHSFALPAAGVLLAASAQILLVDTGWAGVQRRLAKNDVAGALSGSEWVSRWRPPDSGADLWFSRAILDATGAKVDDSLRARAWTDALAAAIRASRGADNRASALYNLANLYWAAGDLPRARKILASSRECSPVWYKPHWLLAEVLAAQNDRRGAAAEMRVALDLAGRHAPALEESAARIVHDRDP